VLAGGDIGGAIRILAAVVGEHPNYGAARFLAAARRLTRSADFFATGRRRNYDGKHNHYPTYHFGFAKKVGRLTISNGETPERLGPEAAVFLPTARHVETCARLPARPGRGDAPARSSYLTRAVSRRN